ncbi:hypothetical protein RvY_11923 [Ramazzottius varieornatus]|uniref:Uncharacterized protein n=1 Tax=Ramazzottius varieornatus TaxID=947166 RepID=A0A1D1VHS0_RAMVA|nr:hypothetical protein RvY_11923 [Ramazzottius varieornatus]
MTEKVEEEFGKALKARCATRWKSNFIMGEHALQLDWDKVGLDKKYRLSPDHEVVLKHFVKITKPFQDAFMKLQRHHIPAICNVLPILFGLRIQLTNMIASGECMLLEKYSLELLALLEERFDKLEDDDLYLAAALQSGLQEAERN